MIGIYKITKINNGKSYIGKSNNIERRFKEHQTKGTISRIPVDAAIKKYGINAFTYEIIEECPLDKLNEREQYWIKYYNTKNNGYNCNDGGDSATYGENNGHSKLTEQDVIEIRKAYNNHLKQKDVYKKYENKISFRYFQNLWQGRSWTHIMPEVFTKENKEYYIYQNSKGQNGASAKLTDEEVLLIRTRYVKETAKDIYIDYSNKISFQTLQQILWGRYYTHLPIYKKKQRRWINNEAVSTIP